MSPGPLSSGPGGLSFARGKRAQPLDFRFFEPQVFFPGVGHFYVSGSATKGNHQGGAAVHGVPSDVDHIRLWLEVHAPPSPEASGWDARLRGACSGRPGERLA
jgi:hypothetical protein